VKYYKSFFGKVNKIEKIQQKAYGRKPVLAKLKKEDNISNDNKNILRPVPAVKSG
jgi:hypothetical protein